MRWTPNRATASMDAWAGSEPKIRACSAYPQMIRLSEFTA